MHGVSFSASGTKLAWVGHDSSISVVNAANDNKMATIKGDFLPFMACVWASENSIITAGNGCIPLAENTTDTFRKLKSYFTQSSGLSSRLFTNKVACLVFSNVKIK